VRLLSENPRFARFQVGEWSYGEPDVVYWDAGAQLHIGRFTSIAPGVTILLGGEHHLEWVTNYPFPLLFPDARSISGYPYSRGDVTIGSDVWIGQNALILSGVTIGDGAVIGANSVITRDVDPFSIWVGNPARLIRHRFSADTIAALQRIAWWEWPIERVKEAWPLLCSADIDAFIRQHSHT
jgi:acetyltransferase-like isoleucine patch superfamily enzyme